MIDRRRHQFILDANRHSGVIEGLIFGILFCILLFAGSAHAHEFKWLAPEKYVSGEDLPPGNLLEFRLYCDYGVSFDAIDVEKFVEAFPGSARSAVVSFAPGTKHRCSLTAVDVEGDESRHSNQVVFTEPAAVVPVGAVPLAPTMLTTPGAVIEPPPKQR